MLSSAQFLIVWSQPESVSFAALAGDTPVQLSLATTTRNCLNRAATGI